MPNPPTRRITHDGARRAAVELSEDNSDTVPRGHLRTVIRYIEQQESLYATRPGSEPPLECERGPAERRVLGWSGHNFMTVQFYCGAWHHKGHPVAMIDGWRELPELTHA